MGVVVRRLRRGLDIPLPGEPEQRVAGRKRVRRVALLGPDHVGMKPALLVREGDSVRVGDPLFECRKTPGVLYASPAGGRVAAVRRGERRAFEALEIEVSSEEGRREFPVPGGGDPGRMSRKDVVALMTESGLWTALRERPFSKVPRVDAVPRAVFVPAMDTNPLAVDPAVVVEERGEDFRRGLLALSLLAEDGVHVAQRAGGRIRVPREGNVRLHEFAGPHPAGNVGTHIHFVSPVSLSRRAWHMGCQDVVALGRLLATGRLSTERVVSIAGPGARFPRLVSARLGASLAELVADEAREGPVRVVSGSVLNGRAQGPGGAGFLGRFHTQVSLVPEDRSRTLLGWCSPGASRFSIKGVFLSKWLPGAAPRITTRRHGSPRSIVPVGSYESVVPLDVPPTHLLRALAAGDHEGAEEHGCLELDEEDLALCTFVCPGKTDFGPLLREALGRIEKEG